MSAQPESCVHPVEARLKVIDKLGDMRNDGFGGATAKVVASHVECTDCGAVLEGAAP